MKLALFAFTAVAFGQSQLPFPGQMEGMIFDDFNRPNSYGAISPDWGNNAIGRAATGQPYHATGYGYQSIALVDHRFMLQADSTVYLFAQAPYKNFAMGGQFSLDASHGSAETIICIAAGGKLPGASAELDDLVHLTVGANSGSWEVMIRQGLEWTSIAKGFSGPSLKPGKSYDVGLAVQVLSSSLDLPDGRRLRFSLGAWISVKLPDGTVQVMYSAIAPDLVGATVFWEIMQPAGSYRTRWEQLRYVPIAGWGLM